MKTTYKMVTFQADGKEVSLYFEVETLRFDYQNDRRDFGLRFYAVTNVDNAFIESNGSSYITFAARDYYLPNTFTLKKDVENVLGQWQVTGLSNENYPLNSVIRLYTLYFSDQLPMHTRVITNAAFLGKMYYSPEITVTPDRTAFGGEITFSGLMLSQGYNITAKVMRDGQTLASQQIDDVNNSLICDYQWLSAYPESREITLDIVFEADYRGNPLPETSTVQKTFYLENGDGLPGADISAVFPSENEIISGMQIAVKNKTGAVIRADNAFAMYGATVTGCKITFDGETSDGFVYEKSVLTESGVKNYTVKITDSRGSVYTYSGSVTVYDYAPPDFTATVKRTDTAGNESRRGSCVYIQASLIERFDFGGKNTYRFYYSFCKSGQSVPQDKTEINPETPLILEVLSDISSPYDVYLYCEDSVGGGVSKKFVLECDRVELNIAAGKIGVGKFAGEEKLLDCAWPIKSGGDITFTLPDGQEVSLSEMFEGGYLVIKSRAEKITDQARLSELLSPEKDGITVLIADVESAGLSLPEGRHLMLIAKAFDTVTVKEI